MRDDHPLRGAWLRFERTDRHLAEAEKLVLGFSRACEQHLVSERDPSTGGKFITIKTTPGLPVELPLVVSDAVHNMRAALDYIVYELAKHDSGKVQK